MKQALMEQIQQKNIHPPEPRGSYPASDVTFY